MCFFLFFLLFILWAPGAVLRGSSFLGMIHVVFSGNLKAKPRWGYDELGYNYQPFRGMNLLDIGMGQGPMGVVAISVGVKSYKGMDPALCINQHARTRDKKIGRAPNPLECEMIKTSPECKEQGEQCPMFQNCTMLAARKYRAFPHTGLEIMQAYEGRGKGGMRLVCFTMFYWESALLAFRIAFESGIRFASVARAW